MADSRSSVMVAADAEAEILLLPEEEAAEEAAKARRVWRKEESAARARVGGNHSRVWRRIS